jgi:hypothetical protein
MKNYADRLFESARIRGNHDEDPKAIAGILDSATDPECFRAAAATYALGSLELLNRSRYKDIIYQTYVVQAAKNTRTGEYLPQGLSIGYLTAALINTGHLEFARPSDLGLTPTDVRKGKQPPFVTFYCCSHARHVIYPYLEPVELGLLVTHELDHFFRDRRFDEALIERTFSRDGKIDWTQYLVADESLSIIQSIHRFYELSRVGFSAVKKRSLWNIDDLVARYAELRGDSKLFQPFNAIRDKEFVVHRKGSFSKYWETLYGRDSYSFSLPSLSSFLVDQFLIYDYESPFCANRFDCRPEANRREAPGLLQNVYADIGRGYFPHPGDLPDDVPSILAGKRFPWQMAAFAAWSAGFESFYVPTQERSGEFVYSVYYPTSHTKAIQPGEREDAWVRARLPELVDSISSLMNEIEAEPQSSSCRGFADAVDQGFQGYIGLEINEALCRPGDGGGGVKGGGGGVKGGGHVRPCLIPVPAGL